MARGHGFGGHGHHGHGKPIKCEECSCCIVEKAEVLFGYSKFAFFIIIVDFIIIITSGIGYSYNW